MATSWVEIDTYALIQNVRVVRKVIGDMPIWAVVKANAYGHDLLLAAESLWRGGVDGLLVSDIEEAKKLSEERYKLPILILHPIPNELLSLVATHKWQLVVPSMNYYREVEHYATMRQKNISIHLELETGMHRTGLSAIDIETIIDKNERPDSHVKITGLFTHLYAPSSASTSRGQIQQMEELRFALQRKDLTIPPTHVFASKGLGLYGEENIFDAVRLGSSLYGFCPHFPDATPALSWKTKVIALGEVKAGETVGYNGSFQAKYRTRLATLPVGYADGLDKRMGNNGFILIGGKACPIVGEVGMSHTVVDISSLFKVDIGDEAVILGEQKGATITLADIYKWTKIYEYEFITRISSLIPRIKTK